ncbi:unnamed protein product [Prunus armeniaca]
MVVWVQSTSVTDGRSFLSLHRLLSSFCRRCLHNSCTLGSVDESGNQVVWTGECELSSQGFKRWLITTPILTLSDDKGNFLMYSGASLQGFGMRVNTT